MEKYKKYTKEQIESWPDGHKMCRQCDLLKPLEDFHKTKSCLFDRKPWCKQCERTKSVDLYYNKEYIVQIYNTAKSRASYKNIPFELTLADIVIPDVCPVLGITLDKTRNRGQAKDSSPSVDRIIPALGYVPGNIAIISTRANNLKNNASTDELLAVVRWMQSLGL